MTTNKIIVAAVLVVLATSSAAIFFSDNSDALPIPSADQTIQIYSGTVYTNTSTITIRLSESTDLETMGWADLIAGAKGQNTLSVNAGGLPTWITYQINTFPQAHDVVITISPGAVVSEVFWVKFSMFGTSVVFTMNMVILDGGSVIPPGNYNQFTLSFDARGGSWVTPLSAQTTDPSYTFDISAVKPTKSGYKLEGWTIDSAGLNQISGSTFTLTAGSNNAAYATLYAVWSEDRPLIPPTSAALILYIIFVAIALVLAYAIFSELKKGR